MKVRAGLGRGGRESGFGIRNPEVRGPDRMRPSSVSGGWWEGTGASGRSRRGSGATPVSAFSPYPDPSVSPSPVSPSPVSRPIPPPGAAVPGRCPRAL